MPTPTWSHNQPVKTMKTPKQVLAGLTPGEGSMHDVFTGKVPVEQVVAMLLHRSTRSVLVSAPVFGLLPLSKRHALDRLYDEFFIRRCERLSAKHGTPVLVSISMTPTKSGRFDLWLHTIGVWKDEFVYAMD